MLFITTILFVSSSAVIAGLLVWHWRELWVPSAELPTKQRQQQKKHELTLKQLERSARKWRTLVTVALRPVLHALKHVFSKAYHWLREIEGRYQQMVKIAMLSGPQRAEVISQMLAQAEEAAANGEWDKAEEKFIDVITVEKTHRRAYEGLANVYFQSSQWKESLETYRFLAKLMKDDGPVLIFQRWAQSAMELKRMPAALEALRRAIEIEPNNPRTLDLYCESAILGGRIELAEQAVEQLRSANSENNKIAQFEQRITELKQSIVANGK